MGQNVLFIREENGSYRVVIDAIPDWEGFDKLIKYLEVHYQAHVVKSVEGPDARRSVIEIGNEIIELVHSDGYGNYFLASDKNNEALILEIGKDLENRLKMH